MTTSSPERFLKYPWGRFGKVYVFLFRFLVAFRSCCFSNAPLNFIPLKLTPTLPMSMLFSQFGPAYKLCFGPKSFIVVTDPVMIRHILRDNSKAYDKGVLAEILAPIMGKGLIPADPATWKVRRRAIVPGFHKAWLNAMVRKSRGP